MRKSIYPILGIILLILILLSSTFAYLQWSGDNTQKTNVVFTISSRYSCGADGGGNINPGDIELKPVNCASSPEYVIKREINISNTINNAGDTIYMDLWLNVDYMDSSFASSENLKYVLSTSGEGCDQGTVVANGNFYNFSTGTKKYLLDGKRYTEGVDSLTSTYYLYIWLDIEETNPSTINKSFSLSLGGECNYDHSFANAPDLYQYDDGEHVYGLVPIYYDLGTEDNPQTKVYTADPSTDTWYSYSRVDQDWANAVLVKESDGTHTREYYQTHYNVEIDQDDILSYFVWIPRYSYTIYKGTTSVENQYAGGTQASPGLIDIRFTDVDIVDDGVAYYKSAGQGINVSGWRTHPSFWWDKNSDGTRDVDEELSGIWVAKFLMVISDNLPYSIPDYHSPSYNYSIKLLFETSIKMSGGTIDIVNDVGIVNNAGSTYYGLSNSVSSHAMKSIDWGAIVYLTDSVYGLRSIGRKVSQIYTNNSGAGGFYTGRSAGQHVVRSQQYGSYTWDGKIVATSGTIGDYYNDRYVGYGASNLNNIYGIYDLDGAMWDLMMAYYTGSNSNYSAGNKAYFGYYGNSSNGFNYEPEIKYWDSYSSSWRYTNVCRYGYCYGNAIAETYNWYGGFVNFNSSYPWMYRGGRYDGATYGTNLYSGYGAGSAGGATHIILTRDN